jgi:hypothetical protein
LQNDCATLRLPFNFKNSPNRRRSKAMTMPHSLGVVIASGRGSVKQEKPAIVSWLL